MSEGKLGRSSRYKRLSGTLGWSDGAPKPHLGSSLINKANIPKLAKLSRTLQVACALRSCGFNFGHLLSLWVLASPSETGGVGLRRRDRIRRQGVGATGPAGAGGDYRSEMKEALPNVCQQGVFQAGYNGLQHRYGDKPNALAYFVGAVWNWVCNHDLQAKAGSYTTSDTNCYCRVLERSR